MTCGIYMIKNLIMNHIKKLEQRVKKKGLHWEKLL